jgi:hypothetical protein
VGGAATTRIYSKGHKIGGTINILNNKNLVSAPYNFPIIEPNEIHPLSLKF